MKHTDRLLDCQRVNGEWQAGVLVATRGELRAYATARTEILATRGQQRRPKAQLITAHIRACPLRHSL